jgi:hypothetical protein
MSTEHLDILHAELPELFQPRDLSPVWDDDLIIIPIENPESYGESVASDMTKSALNELEPDYISLENNGVVVRTGLQNFPTLAPSILDTLGGAHAGAPVPFEGRSKMPPPECLAFYLPFHYYHPTWWGVYLLFEGVEWLAGEIIRRSGGKVHITDAIRASRIFLYYHEAFHHKTECFAVRLEITHRKPFYKSCFERYFQKTYNTDNCLEEGLANASALEDTRKVVRVPTIDSASDGLCDRFASRL